MVLLSSAYFQVHVSLTDQSFRRPRLRGLRPRPRPPTASQPRSKPTSEEIASRFLPKLGFFARLARVSYTSIFYSYSTSRDLPLYGYRYSWSILYSFSTGEHVKVRVKYGSNKNLASLLWNIAARYAASDSLSQAQREREV